MAVPVGDSRIAPFIPSLFTISVVKVALPLFNELRKDVTTLNNIFIDIKNDLFKRDGEENARKAIYKRVKRYLPSMPGRFIKGVVEAVYGMLYVIHEWQSRHSKLHKLYGINYNFYWKFDGTIDTNKTIQELVLNENIDIGTRFEIACAYCLEKSVQTLWAEMKQNGETGIFEINYDPATHFWLKWMREGCKDSWTQAVLQYIPPFHHSLSLHLSLQPDDRQKFVPYLPVAVLDELRLCLHFVTEKEEQQILEQNVLKLLYLYLQWPFVILFLETVEKIWNYIDDGIYFDLLLLISGMKEYKKSFNYHDLLERFWKRSPNHLKEKVKQCPIMRKKFLGEKRNNDDEEITRKRKAV